MITKSEQNWIIASTLVTGVLIAALLWLMSDVSPLNHDSSLDIEQLLGTLPIASDSAEAVLGE